MSIVVIGVNHRTSPLAILERVSISGSEVAKAVHSLSMRSNIREAVVLSTCNRTEVYVVAERFHGAEADVREFFCELGGLSDRDLGPHLFGKYDDAAIAHLFEVAAGLDSDVLGEHEILGQVRRASDLARAEGGSGATLNLLFRHAVEVGKRVRTETAISRSTASVSYAAVEMATDHLLGLDGRRVLVVGAGEMGEGMAVALGSTGVHEVAVTNRTVARAEALAARVGGRVAPFADLPMSIAEADVVLTSTGSGSIVIDVETVEAAMRLRPLRPLLMIDVALPRDIDSAVADLDGVTLLDLDDLRLWAARGVELRAAEATKVRDIVGEEVERYGMEATARQAAPLVASLHQWAEGLRQSEIERVLARSGDLTDEQRNAVEAITRGLVAKLLHGPSVRLKEDAGTPRGERNAAAVRDVFGLQ
jgi:glutamyl-tRNA reductase